jgi:hypothetical protein
MGLTIETFSNVKGANSFYKAVSHPLAAAPAASLIERLAKTGPIGLYDPLGLFSGFAEFYDLGNLDIAHSFVQDIEQIGAFVAGCPAQPVTALPDADIKTLLVAAFDADRLIDHIRHLVPEGTTIESFDALRLDDSLVTSKHAYLDAVNFATNFAFFRDCDGLHSRVATANYWAGYGATNVRLHLILFGQDGAILAEWDQELPNRQASITIDSADIRERFGLGDFIGQLFIHAVGIRGHDVVKYALDVWRDDGSVVTCTHDANAWPADFFAGLPAPDDGEDVVLWVQNSHPCPVPPGAVGLNLMGSTQISWLDQVVPAYGTHQVMVSDLLPQAHWPQQIEIQAGKYFVRPRYEVVGSGGKRRMAHANVERVDLKPDPTIAELGNLMGKGYILPAPILPPERWRSIALPTPMATGQTELPIAALVIDATGREIARHDFGRLPRSHEEAIDAGSLLNGAGPLPSGYGHLELVYDFADGGEADGWLHGLFRYEDRATGHGAETSFGAHIFNTVLTYRNEPQSYAGRAPGLSTRLFLRLGTSGLDTLCHLIYPASTPWHGTSETRLILIDGDGQEIAEEDINIPCGGSQLWRYSEMFPPDQRARAGDGAYVVIRDTTCRLFGYHGLFTDDGPFSLDHMFGF